ncbi:MAG TPA: EamA family transporter [Solirubrobacteraceae bacterium]|jgi:drug/metabolite transporter (DMT)-like permease|nr:EamA family transporter [Solirubrobacteraceae bacterium]
MSARAWALFAAVSTVWGIPYLFIKISVDGGMPPVVLAWGRIVLGAAVLLVLAHRANVIGQMRGHLKALLAYAVFEVCIPFPLIASGEQHVSSSLAAIIIASVPLNVALLAVRFDPEERTTGVRLVGLMVGLVGVALLVGLNASGTGSQLLAAAGILVAAFGYAAGPMILKRGLPDLDPRIAMGGSLSMAAVLLTPLAIIDWPARTPSGGSFASLIVLGLICTALAFILMTLLIREIGPARSVVITYVNPLVAVILGVLLLGESPGPTAIGGLILILAGSWLATRAGARPAEAVEAPPATTDLTAA